MSGWAPKKGRKVHGVPEWLGFLIIMAFCAGLIILAVSIH